MPNGKRTSYDPDLLSAALEGYRTKRAQIDQHITDIQQQLGQAGSSAAGAAMALERPQEQKKRHISLEGRRRIAEAQRKRWAAQKRRG